MAFTVVEASKAHVLLALSLRSIRYADSSDALSAHDSATLNAVVDAVAESEVGAAGTSAVVAEAVFDGEATPKALVAFTR